MPGCNLQSSTAGRLPARLGAGRLPARLGAGSPGRACFERARVPPRHQMHQAPACTRPRSVAGQAYASHPLASEDEASFFIRNLRTLPWQKFALWAIFGVAASQLRDFFGIFMGVFILTFVGRSLTVWVQSHPRINAMTLMKTEEGRRRELVLVYLMLLLGLLATFGLLTIPYIVREGADFINRLQAENIWVVVLEKMRMGIGDDMMAQLERFLLLVSKDNVLQGASNNVSVHQSQTWSSERLTALGGTIYSMIQGYTDKAISVTSGLLSWITHFTVQVAISLVVTCMMLWDWPNIVRGMKNIEESRLGGIYSEVAPTLRTFAQLFGKALQAQMRIAIVNTMLTCFGMYLLRIPGLLLLSLFVFMCSFIPVAGCIISTVPIGFVALTEYGFMKLTLVVLMVFGVHMVEAYGLNPAIYSAHLRLHPLLVLSVLVVAEHSFGVWGLLLAVPGSVFMLDYIIRYPQDTVHDVATKELQYVQGMSWDSADNGIIGPGASPDDAYITDTLPDDVMSPEARSLIRNEDGSAREGSNGAHRPPA